MHGCVIPEDNASRPGADQIMRYLLPAAAILLFLSSCGDTTDQSKPATLNIVSHSNYFTLKVEHPHPDQYTVTLFTINGVPAPKIAPQQEIMLDKSNLKPGPNELSLVLEHKRADGQQVTDTLTEQLFFSYKLGYTVVKEYPHNPKHFIQGLLLHNGLLYESTGLEGSSGIFRYKVAANAVLPVDSARNDAAIFGEGIAIHNNTLYQLSWKNKVIFSYNKNTLQPTGKSHYPRDGWGLSNDPQSGMLIASDGSAGLFWLDPVTLATTKEIKVSNANGLVPDINELEMAHGMIWANIWQTDKIVMIDPATGYIVAWMDLSALNQSEKAVNPRSDVLNGIAYDAADSTFIVSGKLWSKLYRIKPENFSGLMQPATQSHQ